jgi:aminopeptidase N
MAAPGGIHDKSTLSNYLAVRVAHSDLRLDVDFDTSTIHGRLDVTVRVGRDASGEVARTLVLDTKALDIKAVSIAGACVHPGCGCGSAQRRAATSDGTCPPPIACSTHWL